MRKLYIVIIALFCTVMLSVPALAVVSDELLSASAVLMDPDTGQVIFDKKMNTIMFPASTTKVMTAILVLEACGEDDIVTVTETAVDISEPNSAHIALVPGEELTVDQAMYAMMLPSANDAANVLAEHVAGSIPDFVTLMNAKAQELGAVNTSFKNPNGLHEAGHYSTAYDIGLITSYAMKNPRFMKYFGTDLYTMSPTNANESNRYFTNFQYMLLPSSVRYSAVVTGGKVGYTLEAKHTMTTTAAVGERNLVCVVMSSPNRNDKFTDTQQLLDFGFDEFRKVVLTRESLSGLELPVTDGDSSLGSIEYTPQSDFTALIHRSLDVSDIQIEYALPDKIDYGQEIPDAMVFSAPLFNNSVPTNIGAVSLSVPAIVTGKIELTPMQPEPKINFATFLRRNYGSLILILLTGVVVFFSVISIFRYRHEQKLRRLRRMRLRRY